MSVKTSSTKRAKTTKRATGSGDFNLPRHAAKCIRTHKKNTEHPIAYTGDARTADQLRLVFETRNCYIRADVDNNPKHVDGVAIAREMLRQLADELNGNDAMAMRDAALALVTVPFDPAIVARLQKRAADFAAAEKEWR